MDFESILSRFDGVHRTGENQATARCSAHDDRHASLSITKISDRTLLKCHRNCAVEAICEAAGLKLADLFFSSRNGKAPSGLTLTEFAKAKGFSTEFLSKYGVSDDKGGLVQHYLLMNGQKAARQRIRLSLNGDKRFIWNRAEGRPVPYGLWQIEGWRKCGAILFLVEGESDSLTLWSHDLAALGIPGADLCSVLQAPHVAGFARVYIVRENDHGGEVFEKGCAGRLAALEFEGTVAVVEMQRAKAKDPNELHLRHLHEPGAFESEFDALVEMARVVELPRVGLEIYCAESIEAKPLGWLWPNRIPLAKLTLFVGHPGLGKSFAALDVVARVTSGRQWPDGCPNQVTGGAIVFSAEDGLADTIIPRLLALGAQRGRIWLARRVREADEAGQINRRGFNLAKDLPHIERLLDRYPDVKLIVIDPVSAYLARTDSYKNSELRSEVLDPLSELAERRDVAILAITHFNKGGGSNGLERVSGSIAFPAAARAVWGIARDPEEPSRRLMVSGKSNLGPEVDGLAFRIGPGGDGVVTLQWLDGAIDENLSDLLRREQEATREGSMGAKLETAKALWCEMLRDGPRPVVEVETRARELRISESTLKRARWELGVRASRHGFGPGSVSMVELRLQQGDQRTPSE